MRQLPSVKQAAHYLDGFLAAAQPGSPRVYAALPILPVESDAIPLPEFAGSAPVLSPEEEIKHRLHPLDSFLRLVECVETNLPPAPDDQFRFQWFGLFYQAPRQDAFVLRLRLPGGRVAGFQLLGLAEIAQRCAGGEILLNLRGGLDIPGVPLRMAVEILRRVEGIGLSSQRTGGDCVQCIRGGEREGLENPGMQSVRIYPLICALEQAIALTRHLADLPRGCEIVFETAEHPWTTRANDSPDTLILQLVASGFDLSSPDADLAREAAFLLVLPGWRDGGWRLSASQVVTCCLKLLGSWASGADRTDRQNASLAVYYRTLSHERIGALLDNAEWQPVPRAAADITAQ